MLNPAAQDAEKLEQIEAPHNGGWHRSLAEAIRDPVKLIDQLKLPDTFEEQAIAASELFPLRVPQSFARRMQTGDPNDPLLLQVLPLHAEFESPVEFQLDAVNDQNFRKAPGLLHKYQGRVLLIATGACAVHCRYCFRRHYPYANDPRRIDEWTAAFDAIRADDSIKEVILSGGDPLMLRDDRLRFLIEQIQSIPHVNRLRIHSRLPIVLPDRITSSLIDLLRGSRLTPFFVVHSNHANELVDDCADALRQLATSGISVLNQTVLLRGINDNVDIQANLCERLIDLSVIPYYLHQMDQVIGTSHFIVDEKVGETIVSELRRRLPGYAVPRFVREIPGEPAKTVLKA